MYPNIHCHSYIMRKSERPKYLPVILYFLFMLTDAIKCTPYHIKVHVYEYVLELGVTICLHGCLLFCLLHKYIEVHV